MRVSVSALEKRIRVSAVRHELMRADIPAAAAAALRGNAQRQRNQLHKDAAADLAARLSHSTKCCVTAEPGCLCQAESIRREQGDFFSFLFFFLTP